MANWYEMLQETMEEHGDDFETKKCTVSDDVLKIEFNSGFGIEEGKPFTAWGKRFVYFPLCYDGSEWVGYAPRRPCTISMTHQGGG